MVVILILVIIASPIIAGILVSRDVQRGDESEFLRLHNDANDLREALLAPLRPPVEWISRKLDRIAPLD